jgi:hypothetical protein
MSGKIVRFSLVLVFLLIFSVAAYADVIGSTWGITGTAKQKISLKGRSSSQLLGVSDQFEFGSDYGFSMIGLPDGEATWGYVKKKFAVYVDNDYLVTSITANLTSAFESEGYTVDITNPTITKNSFTGKEMKDGTIKGKWNVVYSAYLYVYDFGLGANLKYKSTVNFTGARLTGVDILELDPDQAEVFAGESIQSIIAEAVSNGIQETLKAIKPIH